MTKEKVQTSQELAELVQETEAEIEQEPKAVPGGFPRKARRCEPFLAQMSVLDKFGKIVTDPAMAANITIHC